jgi:soluble lytic murein transglycosylase-like protein
MYKYYFDRASLFYQLPKNLLARMAQQESGYDNKAVSNRGAVGLMQIVPRYHPNVDPTNSEASIFYAAEYMRNLYNRFGNWKLALAAYNWGPTNLQKKGIANAPGETKNYVARISHDINLV